MRLYLRPYIGDDGWTATLNTSRGFLALRSPRYVVMFSERSGGHTRTLWRLFGWRLLWKPRDG